MTSSTTIDFFPTDYVSAIETQPTQDNPFGNAPIGGKINTSGYDNNSNSFEDEPPLWEGIDPNLIKTKILAILLRRKLDERLLKDEDLGGPFVICILLGMSLLLQGGKLHFGYIFGYSMLGSIALYTLVNLMSDHSVGLYHVMSVLGYCLLPMIFLALFSTIFPPTGIIGFSIAVVVIAFCTMSGKRFYSIQIHFKATNMFVKVMHSQDQKYLFAYPIALLYACFALIVMF